MKVNVFLNYLHSFKTFCFVFRVCNFECLKCIRRTFYFEAVHFTFDVIYVTNTATAAINHIFLCLILLKHDINQVTNTNTNTNRNKNTDTNKNINANAHANANTNIGCNICHKYHNSCNKSHFPPS